MIKRFARDESGMTLALAIFMIVLIGVLGAGLLTFVNTDLTNVVQVNQGQRALEAADAGVQAAKQQLISDSTPTTNYDGGSNDTPWSYCYGISTCTGLSPTTTGSSGMTINNGSNGSAQVTILTTGYTPASFKVVSTGCVPNCTSPTAKRRVEARFVSDPDVGFPATYFTRYDLSISGSASPTGVSFFALGNAAASKTLGSAVDSRYGKWAADPVSPGSPPYPTSTGSYPNSFNATQRASQLPGLGAGKTVSDADSGVGSRSYGSNTCPQIVNTVPLQPTCTKAIAFPFEVPTDAEDKAQIADLGQRALALENQAIAAGNAPRSAATKYYIDSDPGNGKEDTGIPTTSSTTQISTWPASSTFSTVVFYKFASYTVGKNQVSYSVGTYSGNSATCGTSTPPKGVIVVQNGDFNFASNNEFDGGIIVRAYDGSSPPPGNLINSGGTFSSNGSACLKGYANAGGTMSISGNFYPSSAPTLGSLNEFKGSMEMVSWRELYQ